MIIIHFKTYYSMTDPRNAQHAQHFLISSPLRRYTVPFDILHLHCGDSRQVDKREFHFDRILDYELYIYYYNIYIIIIYI